MSEVIKPKRARGRAKDNLRDTIAIAAMQGILSSSSSMRSGSEKAIAKHAYALAEAMIEYRKSRLQEL